MDNTIPPAPTAKKQPQPPVNPPKAALVELVKPITYNSRANEAPLEWPSKIRSQTIKLLNQCPSQASPPTKWIVESNRFQRILLPSSNNKDKCLLKSKMHLLNLTLVKIRPLMGNIYRLILRRQVPGITLVRVLRLRAMRCRCRILSLGCRMRIIRACWKTWIV